jgi:hypothetical protein
MKPVLSAWPVRKRTLAFAPIAAGIWLLTFLVVALSTQNFFLAMFLPPPLAVGGAYALLGAPEVKRKDGKPLIDPHAKPYLFFALAPLLALLLYPILGIALTQAGLPVKWLAIVSIVLSLGISVAASYFLVGVPNVYATARRKYEQLPPERRPFLFFPLFVVFFLILYIGLGVLTTQLLGLAAADPTALLNIQVLVLTPVCALLAGVLAWLLVGIPKPSKAPAEYFPKVAGKHRRRVFLGTSLLLGIPLTIVLGAILTSTTPLPSTLVLALAVVLGFMLGIGIGALAWGTPARWRQFEDYEPGIHPRVRTPLLVGASIATGLAVAVAFGLAGIDLFWGLIVGILVAALVALLLTGTHRRIAARRGQSTLVPDLPDRMKPLVLFPAWLLTSLLLFSILTYMLPGLVAVNALVSFTVGLLLAFFLLEQPLLKALRDERRRERAKRKAWEARRKERLAQADDPTTRDA